MKNSPHNPAMYFAFLDAAHRALARRPAYASKVVQRVALALQRNSYLASR